MSSYVLKIKENYYFRIWIPQDLRQHFPYLEIKRTLRTKNIPHAIERLRQRKHLGWSGADFARKLHCAPAQVSRWESENSPMPMSNAYELLLRTLVAMDEKVEDYAEHMEEVATVAEVRPAVMQMICAEKGWQRAA